MDPINYSAAIQQLDLSPLLAGVQVAGQRADRQAALQNEQARVQVLRDKFNADQANDVAYQTALKDFTANPTADGVLALSARFPDHQAALESGFKTYTAGQQRDIIGTATSALGALAAGNVDLAKSTLQTRRDALAKAGIDTAHTDAAIALASSEDPAKRKQGMAFLATALLGAVGPETTGQIMKNFGIGAEAEAAAAKEARDERRLDQGDRRLDITDRRTEASIRQGDERVGLSRAAGARAAAKASGGGGAPTSAPPRAVATIGNKHYVKRGGKWFEE